MSQTVRISKADLSSQIPIDKVEIIDIANPQAIIEYSNGTTKDQILIKTKTAHSIPLQSKPPPYTGALQATKIIVEKVPVYVVPNTTTTVYVNSAGLLIVSNTYSINVGDTIRFSSSPLNARQDTTYYVRTVGTTTYNQTTYKTFTIQDAEDSTEVFNVKASAPWPQTRQSAYSMSKVIDPNSPKKEILFKAKRAFSGELTANAFTNSTYYKESSKYITYELDFPSGPTNNSIQVFDRITVTGMINDARFGATSLFNVTNAQVYSVQSGTFITVKIESNITGYATSSASNNLRSLLPRPLTIVSIPASDKILYTKLKDGQSATPGTPTAFTKSLIDSGSAYLSQFERTLRYYIKYTTKIQHNLVLNDIVSVHGIKPTSLNISNKIINQPYYGPKMTKKSFIFPLSFYDVVIGSASEYEVRVSTEPINTASDRKAVDPLKYSSSGFLDNTRYFVRYRLISSDSNQVSKWTGVYEIENSHPEAVDAAIYDGGSNG